MNDNYFTKLNSINVNDKTEKKGNLTYLSWAWAWGEIKKLFPDSTYTVYENANGWNYHTDGRTAWVKTGVTVNGIEHIEYLPVMDMRNNSIPYEKVTSFDVNKAIQISHKGVRSAWAGPLHLRRRGSPRGRGAERDRHLFVLRQAHHVASKICGGADRQIDDKNLWPPALLGLCRQG